MIMVSMHLCFLSSMAEIHIEKWPSQVSFPGCVTSLYRVCGEKGLRSFKYSTLMTLRNSAIKLSWSFLSNCKLGECVMVCKLYGLPLNLITGAANKWCVLSFVSESYCSSLLYRQLPLLHEDLFSSGLRKVGCSSTRSSAEVLCEGGHSKQKTDLAQKCLRTIHRAFLMPVFAFLERFE